MSDLVFSDDEIDVTWRTAQHFVMKFGQFRGKTLRDAISSPKGRQTLRYYLTWPDLRPDAKNNIECVLKYYESCKKSRVE